MAKIRSPNYPNFSLEEAIERVRKIHDQDQNYIIERETAVQHLGYSGLSGASLKTLGTIIQYGLLEKVETGKVRVSELAIDIIHPTSEASKNRALVEAARSPSIFQEVSTQFPGKPPSETSMRAWLIRQEFSPKSFSPLYTAYIKTLDFLRREVSENIQNLADLSDLNSNKVTSNSETNDNQQGLVRTTGVRAPESKTEVQGYTLTTETLTTEAEEYEWIRNQLGKNSSIRIFAKGEIGKREIEKLILILTAQMEVLDD